VAISWDDVSLISFPELVAARLGLGNEVGNTGDLDEFFAHA
jgi:hypothetical protein